MAQYWVNMNVGGTDDHEVHMFGCPWMPQPQNREYLGDYPSCKPAVDEAKRRGYSKANGCIHCAPVCHSGR